jgi:SAM-dependent methyltransferase
VNDYDPRLIDLYDADNPDGPDHDFYRALADELGTKSVLDLGCGTGMLTVTFAREGRSVVGVDPSATMLAYARRRANADGASWIVGDSRSIPTGAFDYAVMTGNVAQHISDADWDRTLRELRQALTEGGTLAFESRNPAARAWENWSARTSRETAHGTLTEWMEVEETPAGTVTLDCHNLFAKNNETVTETLVLVFRDRNTIERQLGAAGFVIDAVYGGWDRRPFTESAQVMVFVASVR